MGINVKDIKLNLPEGLEQVGKPRISGKNTAEVTLRATKEVKDVKIGASYKDEASVETDTITSVPAVVFNEFEYAGSLVIGETITVTATFDKAPYLPLFNIEISGEGFTEVQAPQVSGNTIVAKYKVPDKRQVECAIKASYNGKSEKVIKFSSQTNEQIFLGIEANPMTANVGQDVVLTCNFRREATDADKPRLYKVPEGAVLKTDWQKSGKTFKVVYTVKTPGDNVFSGVAHEGKPYETARSVTVKVNPGK